MIISIEDKNDMFCEICINDHTGCRLFLNASKNNMKQWEVKAGDIVRIRSIIAIKGSSNYIELRPTSHFIKFQPHSKVYKEIEAKLRDDQTIAQMMSNPYDEVVLPHPITISRTSDRYNSLPVRTFFELFHDTESPFYAPEYSNYYDIFSNPQQPRQFRMKFSIMRIDPNEVEEFVQLFCDECNTTSSLKKYGEMNSRRYSCPQCDDENTTKLIYQLQFLAKDESTEEIDKVHRLLLYTHNSGNDNCAAFFGGIKPCNLYSNIKELEKIRKYVNLMTRYNVNIEAVVELQYQKRRTPYLMIYDCILQQSYLTE
jgi:hypothetical protein